MTQMTQARFREAAVGSIRRGVVAIVLVAGCWLARPAAQDLTPPLKPDSVRFGVIGDNGTGAAPQYEVGRQLAWSHEKFPFSFVIMMGDNLYGTERPQDFVTKFETPYQDPAGCEGPLLRQPGQSRRSEPALLQAVQHGRQALLLVQEGQRALLRPG